MANEKKVTLTIDGVDASNKKSSTKIPYVNPNASDEVMRTFANKCAALSTDTHTATTKTTDEDITTAATPKPKLTLIVDSEPLAEMYFDPADGLVYTYHAAKYPSGMVSLPTLTVSSTIWIDDNVEVGAFKNTNNFVSAGYTSPTEDGYNIGVCIASDDSQHHGLCRAEVIFYFSETETTAATQYKLTVTSTAGEATFIQL